MSYNLYTAEYHGEPNHVALFLETNKLAGKGILYHVVGNILNGMDYETKTAKRPEESYSYVPGSIDCIGTVKEEDVGRLEAVCENIPPPGKQLTLSGKKLDPSKPLRRCGEWVEEAIDELRAQDILQ